jgi:hypothetical protein
MSAAKVYDADGDGALSPLEKLSQKYDKNGDGKFTLVEVQAIIRDMTEAKKEAKNASRLAAIVTFVALLACGVLLGLVLAANEASKESHVSGSVQVDLSGNPLQVASNDFAIGPNGQMLLREQASTGRRLEEGPAPKSALSVAQAMTEAPISSLLSDDAFKEMTTLTLQGPNSDEDFVSMSVLATARYSNKASRCGTIVVIYTHLGEVTLDGTDIYFEERIAHSFTQAGFATTVLDRSNFGGRRKLNAAALLQGLFNAVADLKEARCTEMASTITNYKGLVDGPLPDLPTGTDWKISMISYRECPTDSVSGYEWCVRQPGVAKHPTDHRGKLFWKIDRNLDVGAAIVSTSALSWDTTDRKIHSYQVGSSVMNWETMELPDGSTQTYNCFDEDIPSAAAAGMEFETETVYHGATYSVQGFPARKFTFKLKTAEGEAATYLDVWDRVSDNRMLRMRTFTDPQPNTTLVAFEDVISLQTTPSITPQDETCSGAMCVQHSRPDFGGCIMYGGFPGTNTDMEGSLVPLALKPPTKHGAPKLAPTTTSDPVTTPWVECVTARENAYLSANDTARIKGIPAFKISLASAKDICYKSAACTGFSWNPDDITYFYSAPGLTTCADDGGVAMLSYVANTQGWTTVSKVNRQARRQLQLTRTYAVEIPGGTSVELSVDLSDGSFDGLTICPGRRRLEDDSEEQRDGYAEEIGTHLEQVAPVDKRDFQAVAERRRRLALFEAGWSGCLSIGVNPFSAQGCVNFDVALLGSSLVSLSACAQVDFCGSTTSGTISASVNLGDGWLFGAGAEVTIKAVLNGPPGSCGVMAGKNMHIEGSIYGTLVGFTYTYGFGPSGFSSDEVRSGAKVGAVEGDRIGAGGRLKRGSRITSENGDFWLEMQGDGNAVIYEWGFWSNDVIWSSNTRGNNEFAVQSDGNLVIYEGTNVKWASGSSSGSPGKLVMQNDGNLVFYTSWGGLIWHAGSCRRC